MLDVLNAGATVNPAVGVALFVSGSTNLDEMLIRISANLLCSLCAFQLMKVSKREQALI